MARRSGSADLPLRNGRVPPWLGERMTRLNSMIGKAIVHYYGAMRFCGASRVRFGSIPSAPCWAWTGPPSGVTTSVMGALKGGLAPLSGSSACLSGRHRHDRSVVPTGKPIPMPGSRKPPRKAAAPRKPSNASVTPHRQSIEGLLATITGGADDEALSKAQEVMYDAWERTTSRSRIALARKALTISPLCADAYNLLAGEAKTPEEARDLYARGVEAGEKALGPASFEEFDGHFWGFLETRPYMRARLGLAISLLELGDEDAALEHFRAMLKLNPNDNQGIRYLLLAGLFGRDDLPAAKALLASYPDEWSANWLYARALIAFREGTGATPATLKLLKDARSSNKHVPAILAGIEPLVLDDSGYVTVGGPDEATLYVTEFGKAWKDAPGAIAWLINTTGSTDPKRPRAKTRTSSP